MKAIKLQNQTGRQMEAFVTDCGRVYLPAALFGNADQILLCCGYDGTETIRDAEGRIYAPADWLAVEFPEHRARVSDFVKATELENEKDH